MLRNYNNIDINFMHEKISKLNTNNEILTSENRKLNKMIEKLEQDGIKRKLEEAQNKHILITESDSMEE